MDDLVKQNVQLAKAALNLQSGDKVVITSGLTNSSDETAVTNFMKIEEI